MSKNLVVFTDENFQEEVINSLVPVIVDFTATWCGPCKMLAPIIEKLADELEGQAKVGKFDIDGSVVPGRFGIRGVPTVIVFSRGVPVAQHYGARATRETFLELLAKV